MEKEQSEHSLKHLFKVVFVPSVYFVLISLKQRILMGNTHSAMGSAVPTVTWSAS